MNMEKKKEAIMIKRRIGSPLPEFFLQGVILFIELEFNTCPNLIPQGKTTLSKGSCIPVMPYGFSFVSLNPDLE